MNKLKKILISSFILCILLTNITLVYGATPSIQNIAFPGHTTQTDSSNRFYVVPNGKINYIYMESEVTVSCSAYDVVSAPVVYYNGKQIGKMYPVSGSQNLYKLTWKLDITHAGRYTEGPKELKIVATGKNGTVSSSKKVYFTSGNKAYYDALMTNWTFVAPGTTDYNCLAYVLGKSTKDWPWKNKDGSDRHPTNKEVISYLEKHGYKETSASNARIIAYGYKDDIVHFAFKTSSSEIIFKFGEDEVIRCKSTTPFKKYIYGGKDLGYGTPQLYFK